MRYIKSNILLIVNDNTFDTRATNREQSREHTTMVRWSIIYMLRSYLNNWIICS